MDKGFRPRAAGAISAEIKVLKERYGISYISFEDELLMSNVRRTKELSQTFLDEDLNIKWSCNGRLNFAEPDVLKLMKKSGCVFINYGIECMDNEILKVMNKHLTVDQVTKGIEATLKEGISPGINIIFGNIGEDERTLEKGVEFLLKHDDQAQFRTIRPVTPYPGCALYYYAIEHNLLGGVEDFYENKHLNSDLMAVNFTKLSDDRFYEVLYAANKRLIDNYFSKQKDKAIGAAKRLYLERDPNFRGFRQT